MSEQRKIFREFERIERGKNIDGALFSDFKKYIKTNFLNKEVNFFEIKDDTIIPQNYVGSFYIKDTLIEILPKVRLNIDEIKEKERLFEILNEVENLNEKNFGSTYCLDENLPILEIYINKFINEVLKITKEGLLYSYENKVENSYFFKGKLNIKEQIKNNLAHKERFMVERDEFSVNSVENILIKICLEKLYKISENSSNLKNIKKLLRIFSQVKITYDLSHYLKILKKDKRNNYYLSVLNWIKFFLKNERQVFISKSENEIPAMFFPMETIYEEYISKKLRTLILGKYKNLELKLQDKEHSIFQTFQILCEDEKKEKNFKINPDIVIEDKNKKEILILDTKWKILDKKESKYNISQSDIYQIMAYINIYNNQNKKNYFCKRGFLIYPRTEKVKELNNFIYGNKNFEIHICFVDLSSDKEVENSLVNLLENLK